MTTHSVSNNKGKLILIADDDKFLTNIYEAKLKKENYEVLIARDGEQVMEVVNNQKPDLVILDYLLPIKNGLEILEEFRKDSSLKDIPVILLSNIEEEQYKDKAKKLGAIDYFVKSDTLLQSIVGRIHELLK